MKHLTIKARLTLLYTLMTSIIVCIVFGILFSFGEQEILTSAKTSLEERVSSAYKDMDTLYGELRFDSDLMELEDGVYLSVYTEQGELLYGRLPYGLQAQAAFEDGRIQELNSNGQRYYLMDMQQTIDTQTLYIRGIISISTAQQEFRSTLHFMLILFPLLIILTAIFGYLMARRALSPVARITKTVQDIQNEQDLSRRIELGKGQDEIYRLAATFDSLLESVEAGMKREQQFTADVSHELRTPISVILMQCEELLQKEDLLQTDRAQIEIIQRKARSLSQMIAQLLLLSRADQGRAHVVMERLNASELCTIVTEEARLHAEEKQITLRTEIAANCYMLGDQTLLIRMWVNLLNNAIQFTEPKGHIDVCLRCQDEQLIMMIRDDGCGIQESDLPHIWERFYQADKARSAQESSGLGLSMVKWISEVHHGTITVESTYGKGTTFMLCFPVSTTAKTHT